MKRYKINVLTPPRLGGPFYWAQNLVKLLNSKGITSQHIYRMNDLFVSPFYQNADIIHAALPMSFRLWKKKYVFTIKGDYSIERRRWRFLNSLAIIKADIVTTPSIFLKKKLQLKDAIVIPNAIFSNEYFPVNHTEKNKLNLVTVTNFVFKDKSNGILNIIKNIEELQKSTEKQINYTVVGGGPYLQNVIKSTQNAKIPVLFTGFIHNPKTVLQQSDIFVYYSIHDNFPNVFLEAMASGLPIVTNCVGAVDEIIETNKSGFIAINEEEYQKNLQTLISDHKLRELIGKNARRRIEEKFDWDSIILQYISIYENLISS